MAVYLVTYDLNRETKRPPIVEEVKKFGTWAKLSESSYAIVSDLSPEDVYQKFSKHLDGNDQLYVISLKRPFWGQGSKEVNEWLAVQLTW